MSFTTFCITITTLVLFVPSLDAFSYPGSIKRKPRIVGGTKVESRLLYPFQISVRYKKQHVCGGTLIKSRFILTAAHCAFNEEKLLSLEEFSIVAGDLTIYEQSNSTIYRKIWKRHQHPRYFSALILNDISILELSDPLEVNNFVKPIAIAESNPVPGTICKVSGWGITKKGGTMLVATPYLMDIDLCIIPSKNCSHMISWMAYDNSKICAYSSRGCPNLGDSGGPLVCNGQLSGIISFGKKYQCVGAPSCFTSIKFHRNWIRYIVTKSEYSRRHGDVFSFSEIFRFILVSLTSSFLL